MLEVADAASDRNGTSTPSFSDGHLLMDLTLRARTRRAISAVAIFMHFQVISIRPSKTLNQLPGLLDSERSLASASTSALSLVPCELPLPTSGSRVSCTPDSAYIDDVS